MDPGLRQGDDLHRRQALAIHLIIPDAASRSGIHFLQRNAMDYKCLLYTVQDRVATLTLNRPERLNALGDTLREDLFEALAQAGADANVGAIVITGAGRGFCSGGDVKSMSERENQAPPPVSERFAPLRDKTILAMRDC